MKRGVRIPARGGVVVPGEPGGGEEKAPARGGVVVPGEPGGGEEKAPARGGVVVPGEPGGGGEVPWAARLGAAVRRAPGHAWALAGIVILGVLLRVVYNDVGRYSPADEGYHVGMTRALLEKGVLGYPELVREHLARREVWAYPSPIRWGYLGLTTLVCEGRAPCDGRALAWVSTAAGVAAIVLTFLLGARLVGRRAGLLAAALTITSPLQLALSRRALSDEVYCAAFLAALWALVRLVQGDAAEERDGERAGRRSRAARGRAAAFVAAAAFAFAVKEVFAFAYVGLAGVYLLAPRRRALRLSDAAILAAPPAIFFGGFALLSRSPRAFFELLAIGRASFLGEYSAQYQSGPPHRPLLDLFVLSPIVALLAASTLARIAAPGGAMRAGGVDGGSGLAGARTSTPAGAGTVAGGGASTPAVACAGTVASASTPAGAAASMPAGAATLTGAREAAGGGERILALVLVIALVALMGLPKNVRFAVILDPILRLLAAWTWVAHFEAAPGWGRGTRAAAGGIGAVRAAGALAVPALINGAVELALFQRIFVTGKTYDPTTHDVLQALGALPRRAAAAEPDAWPAVFFAAASIAVAALVLARRSAVTGQARPDEARSGGALGAGASDGDVEKGGSAGAGDAGDADAPEKGGSAGATSAGAKDGGAAEKGGSAGASAPSASAPSASAPSASEPTSTSESTSASASASVPGGSGVSRRERVLTIGIAAVCVAAALFAGRSCGAGSTATPGAASVAPADPAAAEVSAGLAATDPGAAVQHFRNALELYPGHYGATFQLARALDRAGRQDEARQQWERVLRMAEQARDQALVEAARARLAQGDPMALGLDALYTRHDPAAAAARFREVLAKNPDHYGASYQLGVALDQAGKPAEARPVWQKMLGMAEAAGDAKSADTARARLAEIDRALGAPAADDPDAGAMREAVDALYTKHDPSAAAAQFRKILARTPGHYGATYQLGVALDQAGKPAEARPVWQKMLEMAEAAGDAKSAEAARARLAKKP